MKHMPKIQVRLLTATIDRPLVCLQSTGCCFVSDAGASSHRMPTALALVSRRVNAVTSRHTPSLSDAACPCSYASSAIYCRVSHESAAVLREHLLVAVSFSVYSARLVHLVRACSGSEAFGLSEAEHSNSKPC
jgi:hypothetical protein